MVRLGEKAVPARTNTISNDSDCAKAERYLQHDPEGWAERERHFAEDEAIEEETHKGSHCNLQ